jgi:isoleucyl-tRNA synthetase
VNAGKTVKFDADGTEIELSKEDLLISPISKEGFTSESDGTFTVVLSTEITPELAEIGLIREFVSKVQQTRKDSGFEVVDHIEISYVADAETAATFEKYSKDIMADTLADKMQAVEVQNMAEVDVNGKTVKIALKKV